MLTLSSPYILNIPTYFGFVNSRYLRMPEMQFQPDDLPSSSFVEVSWGRLRYIPTPFHDAPLRSISDSTPFHPRFLISYALLGLGSDRILPVPTGYRPATTIST